MLCVLCIITVHPTYRVLPQTRNDCRFLSLSVVKSTMNSFNCICVQNLSQYRTIKRELNTFKNVFLSNYVSLRVRTTPCTQPWGNEGRHRICHVQNRRWYATKGLGWSRLQVWRASCDTSIYWAFVRFRGNCWSSFTSCVRLHVRVVLAYWVIHFWKYLVIFELSCILQLYTSNIL